MPRPLVSVVVSTYDRPERLAALLGGLREQDLPRDRFEVVVVDNGSPSPATGDLLARAGARGDLPLRALRLGPTRGPAGGRNAGWRAAQAPLVAFTDDDCIPDRGWLTALVAAAEAAPDTILQGRTAPDSDPGPEAAAAPNRILLHTREITQLSPQYETCNIAYPRDLLAALGGFDEGYGLRPAGEDTDLAWRAIARGARTTFVPGALVHHAVIRRTPREVLTDATRWGECARLFARHPPAREAILYRRVFWNVWHMLLVRSLFAFALALAPNDAPPALQRLRRALLARHGRSLRRRAHALGASPAWIPYLLLLDVVETEAMLRGAVRHRTPLL